MNETATDCAPGCPCACHDENVDDPGPHLPACLWSDPEFPRESGLARLEGGQPRSLGEIATDVLRFAVETESNLATATKPESVAAIGRLVGAERGGERCPWMMIASPTEAVRCVRPEHPLEDDGGVHDYRGSPLVPRGRTAEGILLYSGEDGYARALAEAAAKWTPEERARFTGASGVGEAMAVAIGNGPWNVLPKYKPEDTPRRVVLESPYALEGKIDRNVRYARRALRDSVFRGEAPIASHLLFTQPGVLSDGDPVERALGIAAGLAWVPSSEGSVVYVDHGISDGMHEGIARAEREGRSVEYREIGPEPEEA